MHVFLAHRADLSRGLQLPNPTQPPAHHATSQPQAAGSPPATLDAAQKAEDSGATAGSTAADTEDTTADPSQRTDVKDVDAGTLQGV